MSNTGNSYQLIAWGQPKMWYTELVNGAVAALARWKSIFPPQEGTTNVSVTEGERRQAKVEGGKTIAARKDADEFTLNFTEYARTPDTGVEPEMPFQKAHDGVIGGEYAIKLQPEYAGAVGLQVDRCNASVQPNWTAEIGTTFAFSCQLLMPEDGSDMAKWQVVDAPVSLSTFDIAFSAEADTNGKPVTVENTEGVVTAASSETWCTVTVVGNTITVKVTANSSAAERTALVTVSVDGTAITTFDVRQSA